MHNLTIKKQITACDLTPEQWGLYDESDFAAARELNRAIVEAFNSDKPGHQKMEIVYTAMRENRHAGATDSETYNVVDEIFRLMNT